MNNIGLIGIAGLGIVGYLLVKKSKESQAMKIECPVEGPFYGTYQGRSVYTCTNPENLKSENVIILKQPDGTGFVIPVSQAPSYNLIEAVPDLWLDKNLYDDLIKKYEARKAELKQMEWQVWLNAIGSATSAYQSNASVSGSNISTSGLGNGLRGNFHLIQFNQAA
mgnify:CR=1 FL=1